VFVQVPKPKFLIQAHFVELDLLGHTSKSQIIACVKATFHEKNKKTKIK
jgi:hypothetical protein